MAYKNALAGLDHGGGKAVIIGDPAATRREALLRAYGRFVESPRRPLRHRLRRRHLRRGHGRRRAGDPVRHRPVPEANGGAGDSSVLTAYGVFQGMRAGAEHLWGAPTLAGRTVGVAGVGKVGRHLVGHLVEDGATVVVTDVSEAAVEARARGAPGGRGGRRHRRRWCGPTSTSTRRARWAARSPTRSSAVLTARIVCGAANNQLAHPGVENAAGRRAASSTRRTTGERRRGDPGRRRAARLLASSGPGPRRREIFDTTRAVLATAAERGDPAGGRGRPARRAADGRGPAAGTRPGDGQVELGWAEQPAGMYRCAYEETLNPGPPRAGRPVHV